MLRPMRLVSAACFAVVVCRAPALAQGPLAFSELQEPATLDANVRVAVAEVAGGYSFVGYRFFARDSVMLVYDDSSLTATRLRANTWMFGPPTTVAEDDGCPAEKVLGRKIARELWRQLGKPSGLETVMIAVRGTVGIDRWTATTMFYYPVQLDGPWVGDPKHPQRPATAGPVADLVIRHASVWTVDAAHPRATAVAVSGDTIVAVGTDAEMHRWIGKRTRIIDAQGRTLLPGFTDSHVHFLMGSLALARVALGDAKNMPDLRATLGDWQRQNPGTGWVLGRGWKYATIGGDGMPSKRDLDDIFPDRPVIFSAYDGHTSWVNSSALALAGITRDTPDPVNGIIVRDASGEPTGALKEKASALVNTIVPTPTAAETTDALLIGLRYASSLGVTRVHSAHGDFELLPLLDSLHTAGALPVRFDVGAFVDPPLLQPAFVAKLDSARLRYRGDWVSANLVKLMVDGVVESHTAAMLAPYTTDSSTTGALFWPVDAFTAAVTQLDAMGFRVMTHAIGDRGIRTVLDAYAAARLANGPRERIQRIEHIETIDTADIARFGRDGVIASMQPLHAYPESDGIEGPWSRAIGAERASHAWLWKQIASGDGRLAFGSDWPVVTLNPWPGVQVAVTRHSELGAPSEGFVPSERLDVATAIAGYTMGPAIAGGREKKEGSITPGKLADFVLLERDPFSATPLQLAQMSVALTIVGGRVVYRRP
jgi:predicted amidohydrolase YtcJ